MSKKFLLKTSQPRITVEHRLDKAGNKVVNDAGQFVVDIKEVISPLFGYNLALQTITSGAKLFEVWALRKRIQEVHFTDDPASSARYLILTSEELELLTTAFRTIDWTFGQKSTFWVEWQEFFDAVQDVPEYDEKNLPTDYLDWKKGWDEAEAKRKAIKDEAELQAKLKRAAAEAKRNDGIARLTSTRLVAALTQKMDEGKLGGAATVDDLPKDLSDSIKVQAIVDYDADPSAFEVKPVEPAVVEAEFTEVPAAPATEEAAPAVTETAPAPVPAADLAPAAESDPVPADPTSPGLAQETDPAAGAAPTPTTDVAGSEAAPQ